MRSYSYLATAAIIAAPLVAAQSLQDLQSLPQCAQTPAETAFAATGCGLNEPACVCKNSAFQASLTNEVMKDCSQMDQVAVLKFSTDFCAKAGIIVNVPQTTEAAAQSVLQPTPAPSPAPSPASGAPPPPPPPPSSSAAVPPASSSSAEAPSSTSKSSTMYPPSTTPSSMVYNGHNSSANGSSVLSFMGAGSTHPASLALTVPFFAAALCVLML